ncbi:MAG: TRAP transporter substrate-binding protein DctP [Spirochaetota bacterium]|nr:TRAP transporter substrate-binding protein DctP [Spirochaetota bacterium]
MRRNIYISVFVLLSFFVSVILLTNAIAKKDAKYVWKMGLVMPDAAFASEYFRDEILASIERVTNGELTMDLYWGGTMGDEEDYIAKMRIDQLQAAGLSVGGVLMACPEMGVLQLPFLFNDFEEVGYIRNKLGTLFTDIYKKNGYKMLVWFDQDFDQIYSTRFEMRNHEDFKKCRFLTHAGKLEEELIKALGASPIPVGVPEVVPSMRTGVCNACISPAVWWMGAQLYTITKYVNTYPLRYSPASMVVSMKAWKSLPAKHRKAVNRELPMMGKKFNDMMKDMNKKCLRAMIDYGIKEVKLTSEEIEEFRKRTMPLWDKLAGKLYPRKLLDEIVYHLRIYRARHVTKG